MTLKNFFILVGCIALCQSAGLIGTVFTIDAIPTWYANLNKPALNPPSWIFGPVWIMLYTLMGIALYQVIQKHWYRKEVKIAISIFSVQLLLNAVWSPVFFGAQRVGIALGVISLMWVSIVATIFAFKKVKNTAAYLLIPYILWVSFALYLNFQIWKLN
ncbi:MAG: TspO/MBR family protein [Patescibacteria group bacterium]